MVTDVLRAMGAGAIAPGPLPLLPGTRSGRIAWERIPHPAWWTPICGATRSRTCTWSAAGASSRRPPLTLRSRSPPSRSAPPSTSPGASAPRHPRGGHPADLERESVVLPASARLSRSTRRLFWSIAIGAMVLLGVLAGPASAAEERCPAGNVLLGRRPVASLDIQHDTALITDGRVAEEGAPWNGPNGVILDGPAASVTYDFGAATPLRALVVQADANDVYSVWGSSDGERFLRSSAGSNRSRSEVSGPRTLLLSGRSIRFLRIRRGGRRWRLLRSPSSRRSAISRGALSGGAPDSRRMARRPFRPSRSVLRGRI